MAEVINIGAPDLPPLYDKQHAAIFDPKRYSIIEASTKTGKTIGCCIWLLYKGFNGGGGRNYAWMAPINRSAMQYGYVGMRGLLSDSEPTMTYWRQRMNEQSIEIGTPEMFSRSQFHCKFWFFGSEDPDSVYGGEYWGGVVDEASRCKRESWHAFRTTHTATGGQIRIIGNVKNRSNWMYELGVKAKSGSPRYGYHRLTVYDAKEGSDQLYEMGKIPSRFVTQEDIDDAKETLPEEIFNRDYLAIPSDDGASFFNSKTIQRHEDNYVVAPVRMSLVNGKLVEDDSGRWYVFGEVPKDQNFVIGVDISHGLAGSNSVLAVMATGSREIVAEYVDSAIAPEDLADLACESGRTVFRGSHGEAFIIWEANGPGEGWFRVLLRNSYSNIYWQRKEGVRGERRTRRYGWHSTRQTKMSRMTDLRAAMTITSRQPEPRIKITSAAGCAEMYRYIYMDDGSIGPDSVAEVASGARANHGDRVIAYMLCVFGQEEMPRFMNHRPALPANSIGKLLGYDKVFGPKEVKPRVFAYGQ